jgi:hypothetical protein
MLMAASFPIGSSSDFKNVRYRWDAIRAFANVPEASGIRGIVQWARTIEGVTPDDPRARLPREDTLGGRAGPDKKPTQRL